MWAPLIEKLDVSDLLKLCVGDTIDAPSRDAFPKTKADLVAATRGREMFVIAREALEAIGQHDKAYGKIATQKPFWKRRPRFLANPPGRVATTDFG